MSSYNFALLCFNLINTIIYNNILKTKFNIYQFGNHLAKNLPKTY